MRSFNKKANRKMRSIQAFSCSCGAACRIMCNCYPPCNTSPQVSSSAGGSHNQQVTNSTQGSVSTFPF